MRFSLSFLVLVSLFVVGCSGKTEVVKKENSNGTISSRGYLDSDGSKTGDWTEWDQNGNHIWTESFKNGKRDGDFILWNKDGSISHSSHYKNGKLDGLTTAYSLHPPYFKVYEEYFKDGEKDGTSTTWYENGQKQNHAIFKDGKMDGTYTFWDENGQIYSRGQHKNGKLDGVITEWDIENGIRQKSKEETWKNGELVSTTHVFSDETSWLTRILVLCGMFFLMRSEKGKLFVKRATEEAVKNWKKYRG